MLSERAMYDRRWGNTPFLGSVLHERAAEIVGSWYPTSITSSELDRMHEMLTVAAIVAQSHDTLLEAITKGDDLEEVERRVNFVRAEVETLMHAMHSVEMRIAVRRDELGMLIARLCSEAAAVASQAEERRRASTSDASDRSNSE